MPDRHKTQPLRFRPPEADRSRLLAYAERTGRAVNAIVSEAIREYLDRHSAAAGIVCSACLTEACAAGIIMCEQARTAGIKMQRAWAERASSDPA